MPRGDRKVLELPDIKSVAKCAKQVAGFLMRRRLLDCGHRTIRSGARICGMVAASLLYVCAQPLLASVAQVCDAAAARAASESSVPLTVLRSITRTETGRTQNGQLEPWPWTVNMEGKGKWFDTEDQARAYVFSHFKRGARSFDVGCFQINYKWHGSAFQSIDEMFDPLANARYAADFLQRLHDELGSWSKAAGAFHSRTPEFAKRYRARFDRIHNQISDQPDVVALDLPATTRETVSRQTRVNVYPLLQQVEHTGARGSLVPLGASGGQALISLTGGS